MAQESVFWSLDNELETCYPVSSNKQPKNIKNNFGHSEPILFPLKFIRKFLTCRQLESSIFSLQLRRGLASANVKIG